MADEETDALDAPKAKSERLDLTVPTMLVDYLKMLAERRTAMGKDHSGIATFLLIREIERLIEAEHHKKEWR